MSTLKIETITAFISTDDEGNEGIMGFKGKDGWVPMISGDEERVKSIFSVAEKMLLISGKPFKVIRFDSKTDVTEEMMTKYSKHGQ